MSLNNGQQAGWQELGRCEVAAGYNCANKLQSMNQILFNLYEQVQALTLKLWLLGNCLPTVCDSCMTTLVNRTNKIQSQLLT